MCFPDCILGLCPIFFFFFEGCLAIVLFILIVKFYIKNVKWFTGVG